MNGCLILQLSDSADSTWLSLDKVFWISVLTIFILTIVGAILRLRQRDKCLKLFHGHHITYLPADGQPIWGDLVVVSNALELLFDAPHVNRRGLVKTSTLIFQRDLARCLAICRSVHALSERELADRQNQIRRSFNPGPLRRIWRWQRNLLNTLRDAFTRTFALFVGRFGGAAPVRTAVQQERGQINELGATFIGMVGNAYEPLLERHIGKPVIIELAAPGSKRFDFIELPGYLVDYSNQFLAVFSLEQEPLERIEVELRESTEGEGWLVEFHEQHVTVKCRSHEVLIVLRATIGDAVMDLAVALTAGATLRLRRAGEVPVRLEMERSRHIDLICPRETARVRFGSMLTSNMPESWRGISPHIDEAGAAE